MLQKTLAHPVLVWNVKVPFANDYQMTIDERKFSQLVACFLFILI